MLIFVIMTCRMPICDMFDEMPILASRGPVMSFQFYKFHDFFGSDWVLALEFILKYHSH